MYLCPYCRYYRSSSSFSEVNCRWKVENIVFFEDGVTISTINYEDNRWNLYPQMPGAVAPPNRFLRCSAEFDYVLGEYSNSKEIMARLSHIIEKIFNKNSGVLEDKNGRITLRKYHCRDIVNITYNFSPIDTVYMHGNPYVPLRKMISGTIIFIITESEVDMNIPYQSWVYKKRLSFLQSASSH